MMASQATFLWLEVNWQKTKVQPLGSREDEPSTITVQGQKVAVVEEFFYLVSPLSTQQLKVLMIFHVTVPLLMQLCKI